MKRNSSHHTLLRFGAAFILLVVSAGWRAAPRALAAPPLQSDFTCADVDEVPTAECEALVAFAPRAASDLEELNWFATNTPCSWFGVMCENGHITELDLRGKNIEATLPSELGNLTELTMLKINGGDVGMVSGSLPAELGALTKLRELVIYSNLLSGPIPPALGNLQELETLNLYGNELSGPIPAELGQLRNLESLILGVEVCSGGRCTNRLSGPLPPALGNLTNLREFLIAGNSEISGEIPQSFVQLEALEEFSYSGTGLCEPANESFQAWSEGLAYYNGTGVPCTTAPTYSITGRILDEDGAAVANVTLSVDRQNPARSDIRATTSASGLYEFTALEPGTYTLVAEHARYTFTPPSIELTVPPPQLQQNFLAVESETEASFIYLPLVSQTSNGR